MTFFFFEKSLGLYAVLREVVGKEIFQKGRKIEYVQIGFRNMHFLHLTGVKTKLSAQRFYYACLAGKLAEKDVEFDSNGRVQQKLMVLPHLHELFCKVL